MPDQPQDNGFLPVGWPTKLRPRVDVDPRSFLEVLASSGQRVLWEIALPCPCSRPGSQGAGLNCPNCGGTGWEIGGLSQVVRAVVVGLEMDHGTYDRIGPYPPGTVRMTVRPEHAPAFWDRMTLLDACIRFSEIAVRKSAGPVRLRYRIAEQVVQEVPLNGPPVERRLRVIRARRGGDGQTGPLLVEGEDFTVTPDGEIDFTRGDARNTAPRVGEWFSVYYVARPSFRVLTYPHVVRDTRERRKALEDRPIALPVNFLCRLEHLQPEVPR